jgi:hypothetical protein
MDKTILEMRLPEGKTCNDCMFFSHCEALFNCFAESQGCEFHPCRSDEVREGGDN